MAYCYRYVISKDIILFGDIQEGKFLTTCIEDKSLSKMEEKIRLTYKYITRYSNKEIDANSSSDPIEDEKQLTIKIIEGFVSAQDCIIDELILLNSQLECSKKDLKAANISRDKPLIEKFIKQIENIKIKENIFRKLADTMAWHIIQHHSTARRLCLNRSTNPVKNTNINSGIRFIRRFNENKMNFALLTDITSFIQIGDALCTDIDKDDDRRWCLVELKEGRTNYEIITGLEGNELDDPLDKKHLDQIQRIRKQSEKAMSALSVINKGSGTDALGDKVKIIDVSDLKDDYFLGEICEALSECEKCGKLEIIIDKCLYIGVYNIDVPLKEAYLSFLIWMASLGVSYPIWNLQDSLNYATCVPLFALGIDESNIIDIVLGRKIVLMCLDFYKWIDQGAAIGLKSKWLNRRESYIKDSKGIVEHENKILEVSFGDHALQPGEGFLVRICFEFLRPTTALEILKNSIIEAY